MKRNSIKFKGKIASVVIIGLLLLPLFVNLVIFSRPAVLGVKVDKSKEEQVQNNNFATKILEFIPNVLTEKSKDIPNKNKDLFFSNEKSSVIPQQDKATSVNENDDQGLIPNKNKPFNTQLIIRDQKDEVVANTFIAIKSSYDITYKGEVTTTVFITNTDPLLSEDTAIAINYAVAKRIGIITNKQLIIPVTVLKKV
jgi:hypothetical protein